MLSSPTIISVRPLEKVNGEFSPTDSSVVRFVVPTQENTFWAKRTFVLRLCDKDSADDNNALAIVRVAVSPPILAKLLSVVVLVLFYVGFALAVSRIRAKDQPLHAKYPAVAEQRKHGWLGHLDPVVLTANSFSKGSVQKLQVLLFSFLVSGMVLSLVLTLGVLSDLSPTIALLLGISAVGAAVAQKTASNRDRLGFDNWAWLVRKMIIPFNEAEADPKWSDLVMTGREFDVYKLQTLIFSVVVAAALLVGGEERLASFAVPETLLGILGLSQVVYVAGTLARPPSTEDLDSAITELSKRETDLQTAIGQGTDTDPDGKLPPPTSASASSASLDERKARAVNAMRRYNKQADLVEIMLESTLGATVDRNKLDPSI